MRFSGYETKLTLIQFRMHFPVNWWSSGRLAEVVLIKPHGNEPFPRFRSRLSEVNSPTDAGTSFSDDNDSDDIKVIHLRT